MGRFVTEQGVATGFRRVGDAHSVLHVQMRAESMGIDYAGMTERAAQMLKDAQDSGAAAATAPAAAAGDAAAAETGAAPGGPVCLHGETPSTPVHLAHHCAAHAVPGRR